MFESVTMFPLAILETIIAFVLSVEFLAFILILIGSYASLWWSIDNFKSVVQVIRSLLVPYFQPQEDLPLSEKYGNWAGNTQFKDFCKSINL